MEKLNPTAASVLGFLSGGTKTGWDLMQAIDNSVGYFWNVTRSPVLPCRRWLRIFMRHPFFGGLIARQTARQNFCL